MLQQIAKFKAELEQFQKNHLVDLRDSAKLNEGGGAGAVQGLIGSLSRKSELVAFTARDYGNTWRFGIGLLIPSEDWEDEWKIYEANPTEWVPVKYGSKLYDAQNKNKDLRHLYAHVTRGGESRIASWNNVVTTCKETREAMRSYRRPQVAGPDHVVNCDYPSSSGASLWLTVMYPRDENTSQGPTTTDDSRNTKPSALVFDGTRLNEAFVYEMNNKTNYLERAASTLAFTHSKEELQSLRETLQEALKAVERASKLSEVYSQEKDSSASKA